MNSNNIIRSLIKPKKPELKTTKWSGEEVTRLQCLLGDGKTCAQIARILKRTPASVQSKSYSMSMSVRKNRPPLSREEFERRVEIHMEKKKCQDQ